MRKKKIHFRVLKNIPEEEIIKLTGMDIFTCRSDRECDGQVECLDRSLGKTRVVEGVECHVAAPNQFPIEA